ncbi:aminopeptidase N [Hamadaea tsunoensis]|uniref:aminopeptidase N n=1 Tax=Hamadaea tsunoensis TaxID=53368 RepID=UPI000400F4F2|nr:aminopeptidase N [Hamadaea tsunoensis]
MPGTKLTYAAAKARSNLLSVTAYEIELDLTAGPEVFRSTTRIRFSATQPGGTTFADLIADRVTEIVLNGESLDPAWAYQDDRILLTGLAADNELLVVADCRYTNTGVGLHRSVDPADGEVYLYTHFEVQEARRVYTAFDQPDLKSRFTFTVTAPADWTVFSNSPSPEPEAAGPDAAVWRFEPTEPLPTYVTALVAGRYHQVSRTHTDPSGKVVPLRLAVRASMAEHLDADEIFEITTRGLDHYVTTFGQPYPFAKYDQIFVPEYNLSAMENAACVTVRESFIFRSRVTDAVRHRRAAVLLHELSHVWFGNLVTMRWWDDLWLKETFATYMSVHAQVATTRWTDSWAGFANADKANAYRQDQLPSTHPIATEAGDIDDAVANFDPITYYKGASVIKQLIALVSARGADGDPGSTGHGEESFLAGIRAYFARHKWGNATLSDLLAALEEASGRDLSSWSKQWLQQAGVNTLRPQSAVGGDGAYTGFTVVQEASAEHPTLRSHRLGIGLYDGGPDGLVRRHRVEVDIDGPRTEVPQLIGVTQPDLLLLNDDDLAYATIRLDQRSLATVRDGIGQIADPLARSLCWAASWDAVRAGELGARTYLRQVLAGIDTETDTEVVQALHQSVLTSVDRFVAPAARAEAAGWFAEAAATRIRTAPSPDLQLAWASLLARLATKPADLGLIEDLLEARTTIEGLTVDTELRWALLGALVRTGRAGAARIDAERERDRTTAGEEYALGARAALPEADAKAAAWSSIVDGQLSNGAQKSIIGSSIGLGFAQSNQLNLLRDYIDRYFAALGDVWAEQPAEVARTFAIGFYPGLFVEPATVTRTDEYLANAQPAPALRRLLIEGRDEVRRALRAQAADVSG